MTILTIFPQITSQDMCISGVYFCSVEIDKGIRNVNILRQLSGHVARS